MKELSASGLADLAGTTMAEVQRLVELGILVPRDGTDPFLDTDVQRPTPGGLRRSRIAAGGRTRGCAARRQPCSLLGVGPRLACLGCSVAPVFADRSGLWPR
jgi:hypothetical protein